MALKIPVRNQALQKNDSLLQGRTLPQEVRTQDTRILRDKKGVYALSLIAEAEQALAGLLQKKVAQKKMSGQEDVMHQEAERAVRKVIQKAHDSEVQQAIEKQMESSLATFGLRSKDLALREHAGNCEALLEQRRNDVAQQLYGLQDTALHAPSQDLREEAQKMMIQQSATLGQVERAVRVAQSKLKPLSMEKDLVRKQEPSNALENSFLSPATTKVLQR